MTTLGAACLRAGEDRRALEALESAIRTRESRGEAVAAADLAFLAMACGHLGRAAAAREGVERLGRMLEDPALARDEEAQGFLLEARAELARRDGHPAAAPARPPPAIRRP